MIKFTKKLNDNKTYTLVSAKKGSKSFKKYFKINKTTGKVTVKKGLKKGIYKVKVKVEAAGFAQAHHADLTIMDGGDHWFHTDEQMKFLDNWIRGKSDN